MNRKDEHVKYAMDTKKSKGANDFDKIRFIHHGFSEQSVSEIDLSTHLMGIQFDTFFYINAMTGGSEWTANINRDLATIASRTNLAMATGSLSAAIKDSTFAPSFRVVRDILPQGIVFANMQASASYTNAQKAIDIVKANALQLHINHPQELLMPEGDRDFKGWIENVATLVKTVKLPIMIKEVGFGMSKETIEQCVNLSVAAIDISGRGGTNFALIENIRSDFPMSYMEDWGQSTVLSLLEAQDFVDKIDIVASGGIRHPLDMIKSLALGAKAVGISGTILHSLLEVGIDATVDMIERWKMECTYIMTALGAKNIQELRRCAMIFDDSLYSVAKQRNLSFEHIPLRR